MGDPFGRINEKTPALRTLLATCPKVQISEVEVALSVWSVIRTEVSRVLWRWRAFYELRFIQGASRP
jgi:hypothetical protein